MDKPIIDSHIHLDQYCLSDREKIINNMKQDNVEALIAVSTDLSSSEKLLKIADTYDNVKVALGYHPEQSLPEDNEIAQLTSLIQGHRDEICAIGEIGLPYYLKDKHIIKSNDGYVQLLDHFISLAKELEKPVALHAVYGDAAIACDLLEKHSLEKAHFHWFKGEQKTIERMIENKYHISITPDVLYEEEIIELVKIYPLELIMLETDGPWPFEGPFKNQMTEPFMIHHTLEKISELKEQTYNFVAEKIYKTTKQFYT